MLVECKQCGAPLDVAANTSIVKCSYCGSSSRVRSMRTLAMEAPAGWSPPKTWTPPQQMTSQPGAPLPYREPPKQVSWGKLILAIVILSLLVTLCPMLFLPFVIAGGFGFGP